MTLYRLMLKLENYFKVYLYSGVMTAPVNDGTLDVKGERLGYSRRLWGVYGLI